MIAEVVPVEVVRRFRHLAARHLGLDIPKSLEPMIGARISKRLDHLQLSLHGYVARLQQEQAGDDEIIAFWDCVRPRPGHFFAHRTDCRRLGQLIQRVLHRGGRRLRFWSAGCGTGEEAYTIALVAEHAVEAAGLPIREVDFKILATDISGRALEMGRRGIFAAAQIQKVPRGIRRRHFLATTHGFQISDEIYDRIVFRQLNLGSPPFPMTGPLDGVFCGEGLKALVPSAKRRARAAVSALLAEHGLASGLDQGRESEDEPGSAHQDLAGDDPQRGDSGSRTIC
ncbi:MAG: CheR family methyltransferase [Polyangia bacterium]|jgi:chemotaxis protein methyltransferase CheR